jgi:hypothetical protein
MAWWPWSGPQRGITLNDPEMRVVLIDGGQLTISWPGRNIRQARDIGAAERRVQKYFVDSSPDELRRHFDIETREIDRPVRAYHLTMVPKRKKIQEGLAELELWVDQSSQLLSAMRMRFPNGDTKLMEFEDVGRTPPSTLRCSRRASGRVTSFVIAFQCLP